MPQTDAHKQKLREAALRRYSNAHEREAQSARMKVAFSRNMHSPEANKKRGATLKKQWEDDTFRQSVLLRRNTPATRVKLSKAAKEQWATSRDSLVAAIGAAKRAHLTSENQTHLEDSQWLRERNEVVDITTIAEELGCAQSLVSGQFAKFGLIPKNHHIEYEGGEQQIVDYLATLSITNIERRNRSIIAPLEIDIYLPDHKIGIEYNGAYWHSYGKPETPKEKMRHMVKQQAAKAAGIRLLQFWDFEWHSKQDICKSILASALAVSFRVGARECDIRTPTRDEVVTFLNRNHIQGFAPYSHAKGLYAKDVLVCLMTLGKSRFKKNTMELIRLASKRFCNVVGGAQRLWAALVDEVPTGTPVTSYCDHRLFTGSVYEKLGFTFQHVTKPGYQYYRSGQVYSRLKFQKHKLTGMPVFNAQKTEAENMFDNGFRRLWDVGQGVYSYTK